MDRAHGLCTEARGLHKKAWGSVDKAGWSAGWCVYECACVRARVFDKVNSMVLRLERSGAMWDEVGCRL